jgi:uncharacterized membrane protein YgcG
MDPLLWLGVVLIIALLVIAFTGVTKRGGGSAIPNIPPPAPIPHWQGAHPPPPSISAATIEGATITSATIASGTITSAKIASEAAHVKYHDEQRRKRRDEEEEEQRRRRNRDDSFVIPIAMPTYDGPSVSIDVDTGSSSTPDFSGGGGDSGGGGASGSFGSDN